jgi:hypothetical protein
MTSLCRRLPSLHRLTAVLSVVLVVLLDLLVASPGLHAWIHHHDGSVIGRHADVCAHAETPAPVGAGDQHRDSAPVGDPDHHCAVTLFAAGVEALLFVCLQLLLLPVVSVAVLRPCARRAGSRPRYWHVPAIGPPAV